MEKKPGRNLLKTSEKPAVQLDNAYHAHLIEQERQAFNHRHGLGPPPGPIMPHPATHSRVKE